MLGRGVALAVIALAVAGCGGSDEEPPPGTVSGPLCQALPSGDDPGAPAKLTREPPDVVLTWIPVATTFEAAVRASGVDLDGTTVLVPSDDAFAAAYGRQELDDLLIEQPAELVEPHVVEGTYSLAELREAGEVTTRAGDTLEVTEAGAMARLGGRATTVCADYAAAGARLHVVDGVLSN